MTKIPRYIENHIVQYAKYMTLARKHQGELNQWLDKYGVYVDGENEWVLDQIIDSIEYGNGDAEHVIVTLEELLNTIKN